MGIEDAGTMAWLLKKLCINFKGEFTLKKYDKAVELYEKIRIPRTSQILDCSKELGRMQELRENENLREELEMMMQGEIMMNGTLPIMFQGATHHYKDAVERELREYEKEEELYAMAQYMPGVFECAEVDKKINSLREEEERRIAFEQMMFGGQ